MQNNFKFTLVPEQIDEIIVSELKKSYEGIVGDIIDLKSKSKLKDYQKQDLKNFKKIKKSIKNTLKYYMTYGEAKEYFYSVKNIYGKV